MKRTFDVKKIDELTSPYPRTGFCTEDWGESSSNISLLDSNDNLALFELESKGHYRGHYFFKVRGKEAKVKATEALDYIFNIAEIVSGLTPVENRAASLMSRWLGFKDMGKCRTLAGDMTIFIMTKQDWRTK